MTRPLCPRRHGSACPEIAGDRPARAPLLQDVCADRAEIMALSLSRFVAAAAMTGDAACWDAAHDCAEALLGPIQGAHAVGAVAAVMRAIRAERVADWNFLPASCCRLTPEEETLARGLGIARRGRPADIADAARILSGGLDAPRIAASLEAAAAMLDAAEFAFLPGLPAPAAGMRH